MAGTEPGRVLIMDDDALIGKLVEVALEPSGFAVSFAEEGAEALKLYREGLEAGKPFDLVILDLIVPRGLGGVETLKKLREIDPDVRAVASSGDTTSSAMANCEEHGFAGALPKPYDIMTLVETVKRLTGRA